MSRKNDKSSMSKILSILAIHTEKFPQSEMRNETGLSNKTIIENLKRLENEGLVTYWSEASKQGGKDKKFYSLTLKGLRDALKYNLNKREVILTKHSDMLLVAKELPLFESLNIKEVALGLLGAVLDQKNCYQGIEVSLPFQYSEQPNIDYDVILLLLMYGPDLFPENYDKFIERCKTDKELDSLIQVITKKEAKRISATMSWQQEWEDFM